MPPARTRDAARTLKERERQKEKEREREREREQEEEQELARQREHELEKQDKDREDMSPLAGLPLRPNSFEAASQTLTAAFEARTAGRLFRDPKEDADLPDPKVFIVSWVDYCNKYGMGYALTDGSVGVHYNDSTTLVLSPDKHHFDFISSRRQGAVYVRKNYTVAEYPEELKRKVYLLKHFEQYIMGRLYGAYEWTFDDFERTKGMEFVQKYLRMKAVIIFKMSHDVLQFNFYDHTKIILSSQGLVVTHIDKDYQLTRHSLAEVMAQSLRPPPVDPEQAKFRQRLFDKLKFIKEVLVSIRNASTAASNADDDEQTDAPAKEKERAPPVSSRSSKASLR
ncbi:hypothetical protein ONZ51_g11290 [Trametes cubensis]|uniref:POLO box domain-containing protein n=1 Tax=Trametes cubensis TaxID=1111947 RepID=A0AAD7TIF6_9APHY|nr:hypothetical protein ONZ51_g11290 [Trametes cubensis]